MPKFTVKAIYDRKKTATKTGVGSIDIKIYLTNTERKFIQFGKCTPDEWKIWKMVRRFRNK